MNSREFSTSWVSRLPSKHRRSTRNHSNFWKRENSFPISPRNSSKIEGPGESKLRNLGRLPFVDCSWVCCARDAHINTRTPGLSRCRRVGPVWEVRWHWIPSLTFPSLFFVLCSFALASFCYTKFLWCGIEKKKKKKRNRKKKKETSPSFLLLSSLSQCL